MAGSEKRGPEHATGALFEGSTCIFTPLQETPVQHIQKLKSMWQKLGARVHILSPKVHDELIARVSHLPHMAAAAIMDCVTEEDIRYAGTGFEDTTRIASGDPIIWRDICKSNAPEIIRSIDRFISSLSNAREMLAKGRFADLEEWLQEAKQKRDRSLASKETDTTL
jgi:prephenate dehydrogenase